MARVVEAVQIFKKVEDVTAAKDDPSPVYLMDELADMARGSAESSEKIADRIAKRLQNKSSVVKFKALRLVRHLVNKGCGQFQRSMQRHANLVREHIHFKGELDPFKGDALNQRVRDAAKEASESLFNTVMAQPVTSLGSRIQGFGSSAAPPPPPSTQNNNNNSSSSSNNNNNNNCSGPGSASATSSSRMVGFGSNSSSNSSYTNPTSTGNGSASLGTSSLSQKGVNRPLTGSYGDAGGAGAAANSSTGGYAAGGVGYTAPALTPSEVLGSEVQLVDSICTPGGMRLAPDPEDLRRFVEAAGSLDGLKVAELLRDKMMDASGPWQQLLRALYALEAVLLQGATQACGEIAVMFQSDPGPVQAVTGHMQATVRERAARVLKLLLGGDEPAAGSAAAGGAATAATTAAAPIAASRTAAAATAPAQQPPVDLLGGLDMLGSPIREGYNGQQQQALQQQQQQRPAAGMAANGTADDMFSGLALGGGASTAPQVPSVYQPVHQPTPGLNSGPYSGAAVQQQQQQGSTAAARGPRPFVDPFGLDFAQPTTGTTAPPPQPPQQQVAYIQQHQQHQQQQQNPQWQQPLLQQQSPQQLYAGLPGVGGIGGMQQPLAATQMGLPTATGGPHTGQHAAHPPQGAASTAGVRPPLDDMFADMSLSSGMAGGRNGPAAVGTYVGGMLAGNAHGGIGPAYGGSIVGGVMGYSAPAPAVGGFGPGVSQVPMSAASSSNIGPGGAVGISGMAAGVMQHPQSQQQQHMARPTAPLPTTHTASLAADTYSRGGIDLLGTGPGPSPPGPTMGPGGMSRQGQGYSTTGASYPSKAGSGGPGPAGGLGVGSYPATGSAVPNWLGGEGMGPAALGMGGSTGAAAGMMVGPGGQVRYMGAGGGQPSSMVMVGPVAAGNGTNMMGAMGLVGSANGQLQQQHGWQQQPYFGQQQEQQQRGGGAVFDFVREQFK